MSHNKQQAFDSTVAILSRGTVLEGNLSLLIKVMHLDAVIGSVDEIKETLTKIRDYCQANSIPENFDIRTEHYRPLAKNATTRGRVKALTPLQPKRRAVQTERKGVAEEVLMALKRCKRALSIPELSEKVEKEVSTVNYAVTNLVKDKTVKRRKAKKSEKTNGNVKYVFEVSA